MAVWKQDFCLDFLACQTPQQWKRGHSQQLRTELDQSCKVFVLTFSSKNLEGEVSICHGDAEDEHGNLLFDLWKDDNLPAALWPNLRVAEALQWWKPQQSLRPCSLGCCVDAKTSLLGNETQGLSMLQDVVSETHSGRTSAGAQLCGKPRWIKRQHGGICSPCHAHADV